jgi:homoserine O-acetyltransferase/O-succinyltransferase
VTPTKYEIVGPDNGPVVAVLGGISSSKHVTSSWSDQTPGWWEEVVGAERSIDTRRFRVLSIDYVSDEDGREAITTGDQARALAQALDEAGVAVMHATVGASYGGMVALAFAAQFPTRTRRVITISAAHESDPMATALRLLQRRVLELGSSSGREREGLAIARGIAMTSYVTSRHFTEGLDQNDSNDSNRVVDRIGSYLRTQGELFATAWTSDRYRTLSLSLDLHRVRPEEVTVPTTVIAITSDRLVPVAQSRELARRLGGPSQLIELDSAHGHDAFLGDSSRIASFVGDLLQLGTEVQS